METELGTNRAGVKLKAVIFDLDGTLVDSLPDIAETLNELLAEFGYTEFEFHEIRKMVGGGVQKLVERALRAQDRAEPHERIQELVDRFLKLYSPRAARLTRLFPGAEDLLKKLSLSGIKIGLCTNKPTGISKKILEELSVAEYFGSVVGSEPGLPKKPDPAPLFKVLTELDVKPSEAIMIGDSLADYNASLNAAIRVALVTFGYSQTPVDELGCEIVLDSFDDFSALLPEPGAAN